VEFPADLTAVEADELTQIEDALVAEFDEMHDSGTVDLDRLAEIAEQVEAVRAEQDRRTVEAERAAEQVAALADRIRPAEQEDDATAEADPDTTDGDDGDGEPDDGGSVDDTAADEVADAQERVPVTASTTPRQPSARAVSRRRPAPEVPERNDPLVTITASADVPGLAAGSSIDLSAVASGLHDRARQLPSRSNRVSVATVNVPIPDEHRIPDGASPSLVASILDQVASPQRLANSLTAAGGWCAPSTNLYDFFELESLDGLLDLPTVGVERGGINFPGFIGFGGAADALWTWTEDDDEAALDNDGGAEDTLKACMRIPCPDFVEVRLEAEGLCVTHGNLTNRAFPELTARFLRLVLNGHLHRLSAAKISKLVADSVAFTPTALPSDAPGDLLSAVELTIENLRSRYRMSRSALVETVFPTWLAGALRASFAARHGVATTNVTDGDIATHLTTRGARPQFVTDWQPLYSGSNAVVWPASVQFLAYPAGSYIEGNGGAIDLGVVRDSRLNETNDYTAAWSEQFYLVARRGPQALRTTVALAVDGVTGCCPAPDIIVEAPNGG